MKRKKMNDKGFSLVELIIVIAIMAVLVVVLAPQYLKYVEKSRNSTDVSNSTVVVTALQVYAADPDADPAFAKDYEFDVAVNASGTASTVTAGAAATALDEAAIKIADLQCKSKTNWASYNIHGKILENGSIEFTYTAKDAKGTAVTAFSDAMTGK